MRTTFREFSLTEFDLLTRPATRMAYSVAGRVVLIEAHDDWSVDAVSQLFARWFLTPLPNERTNEFDAKVGIRCGMTPPLVPAGPTVFDIGFGGLCQIDDLTYCVKFGRCLIVFTGRNSEVDLWVDQPYEVNSPTVTQLISHALSPALRRCGVFEIHSAGVIPPGHDKAVMFAGPSGSGKSTLTSQLARSGWRYLSDDILLLQNCDSEIKVRPLRRFFALTDETIEAVKLSNVVVRDSPGALKARITPQDHFDSDPIEEAEIGSIIFPNITGELRSRLLRLTPAQAMTRLLRLCPWTSYDKPTSAEHISLLAHLSNSASAFVLNAGTDILNEPEVAAELIQVSVGEPVLVR